VGGDGMSAQYTPGPWLRAGTTVYALNDRGFNRMCASVQDAHTAQAELEATAQLMAVAPDLLAALIEAEQFVRVLGLDSKPIATVAASCRAAIAAATGAKS